MPQPLYYPTESLDAAADVSSRTLPRMAEPMTDEALPSWLLRFAAPLTLPPLDLFFAREESRFAAYRSWWRYPDETVLERIAARTGIDPDALRAMTFSNWMPDPADGIAHRFSRSRIQYGLQTFKPAAQYGVCPACLVESDPAYVRKLWTVGWIVACERHGTELIQSCSQCRGLFSIAPLRSSVKVRAGAPHCRCGWSSPAMPHAQAHALVTRIQSQLLCARKGNCFEWAGLKPLTWGGAVALIDLILGVIWIGSRVSLRQQCLTRIESDVQLKRRLTHRSHDGLLMAAWVLDGWPERLHVVARELRVAEPSQQLLLWQPMSDTVRSEIKALLET